MAKLDMEFNANEVPEREDFTPMPPGMYDAMIVASEVKTTKKSGQMIVFEFTIQNGEHSGRKLFEYINIKNDNPKAVEIGFRTLAEIVKSVGKDKVKDTEELHNKRLSIQVQVDPPEPYEKDGVMQPGKPQNSIKKFLPVSGTGSTPKTVESKSATPADQSAVPPWKRKQS